MRPTPIADNDEQGCSSLVANPINVISGEKYETVLDFRTEGPNPIELRRYYNSLSGATSELGFGWRTNFSRTFFRDSQYSNQIKIVLGDGREALFMRRYSSWPWTTAYRATATSTWAYPRKDVSWTLQAVNNEWIFTDEDGSVETYNSAKKLTSIVRPGGYTQSLSYNALGQLVSVVDSYGRTISFTYNTSGLIDRINAPDGSVYSYRYQTPSMPGSPALLASWPAWTVLNKVVYPDSTPGDETDNATVTYHYEDLNYPARMTGVTDARGIRSATWTYDEEGRAISSEHANGTDRHTITYDSADARTVTNPLGKSAIYRLSGGQGYLKRLAAVEGQASSNCPASNSAFEYDANGFVSRTTDGEGRITTFINSTAGRVTSITQGYGSAAAITTTASWHPVFDLPTSVQAPGLRTDYSYDLAGRLTQKTETDTSSISSPYSTTGRTRTWNYLYNSSGLLDQVDGPMPGVSDVVSYIYDSQGYISAVNSPAGLWQIQSVDGMGRPLVVVDPNGLQTMMAYDAMGRITSYQIGGLTTSLEYDAAGNVTQVTLSSGAYFQYAYDAANRLTSIEDDLGNHVQYTLDVAGNRVQEDVFDSNNVLRRTLARIYDELGQIIQARGGNGQALNVVYDKSGLPTSFSNGLSAYTQTFDALGRLAQQIDGEQGTTGYTYDGSGRVATITDPRGLVTRYTYDGFGNLIQLDGPDSGLTVYTYDDSGNRTSQRDSKNQLTSYEYDASNRVIRTQWNDGLQAHYFYDEGSYGKGRLTGISDSSGSTSWAYNAHGRVTSKTQVAGAQTLTTSYGYDTAGRLISQTLPSGKVVGLSWTGQQITGVTLDGQPLASNIAHEPFGPIAQWDFANGQQVIRSYDLSGRMSSHSLGSIGYDTADRITSLSHGGLSFLGGAKTYGYDALDRLTGYSGSGVSIGYSYDANGNRLQQTSSVGTVTSAIDNASNRLTALTSSAGAQSFSYDANGSLLSDGLNSYGYDSAGRLATANGASYAYNGLGQRTVKTVGGTSTIFVYDEQGHLLGEYDGSGTPIQETVWLGDTPIAVLKPSDTYYIHADHLNTPRQIEDQSGDTVWLWDTITFGASTPEEDPRNTGTPFTYNLRHPGQYFDAESGLFQNWHRDYNPSLGRYVESDPIGLAGGINTYAYVGANPITYVDPTGLICFSSEDASAIAYGAAGLVGGAIVGKAPGAVLGLAAGLYGGGIAGRLGGMRGDATGGAISGAIVGIPSGPVAVVAGAGGGAAEQIAGTGLTSAMGNLPGTDTLAQAGTGLASGLLLGGGAPKPGLAGMLSGAISSLKDSLTCKCGE